MNENNEVIGHDWITISMNDDRVIVIKPGIHEMGIPVVLGDGDTAKYMAICGFSERGYQGDPQVGVFAFRCKFNRDLKPGDEIFDEDIEDIEDTDVAIIIKSKQVLANLITSLNTALDKWVAFDDEREKERQTSTESDN